LLADPGEDEDAPLARRAAEGQVAERLHAGRDDAEVEPLLGRRGGARLPAHVVGGGDGPGERAHRRSLSAGAGGSGGATRAAAARMARRTPSKRQATARTPRQTSTSSASADTTGVPDGSAARIESRSGPRPAQAPRRTSRSGWRSLPASRGPVTGSSI